MELPTAVDRELDELARRFGRPITADAPIDDSFKDPIWKRDRFGEVCMVIQRRGGGLLLSIKTFYPRGAFRLPTGGIHHGEGVYDALVREAHEETGLVTTVDRFLARIAYHPLSRPGAEPVFHTFAFLLCRCARRPQDAGGGGHRRRLARLGKVPRRRAQSGAPGAYVSSLKKRKAITKVITLQMTMPITSPGRSPSVAPAVEI